MINQLTVPINDCRRAASVEINTLNHTKFHQELGQLRQRTAHATVHTATIDNHNHQLAVVGQTDSGTVVSRLAADSSIIGLAK